MNQHAKTTNKKYQTPITAVHLPDCQLYVTNLNSAAPSTSDEILNKQFCSRILSLFDQAKDSATFFRLWNATLLVAYRHLYNAPASNDILKLEFYLHIYFATNAIRKKPADKEEHKKSMAELKTYLEKDVGVGITTNAELIQFVALPYVHNPQNHLVFKKIMQKEWVKKLRAELNAQLQKIADACNRDASLTKEVFSIIQSANISIEQLSSLSHNLKMTSESIVESKTSGKIRKQRKMNNSNNSNIDLLFHTTISHRGKTTLDSNQKLILPGRSTIYKNRGNEFDIKKNQIKPTMGNVLTDPQSKMQILSNVPNEFNKTSQQEKIVNRSHQEQLITKERTISTLYNEVAKDNLSIMNSPIPKKQEIQIVTVLKFQKISEYLMLNSMNRNGGLLLQALRQQLTRTNSLELSRNNLRHFIDNDLLLLRNRKISIVTSILHHEEVGRITDTKEELARFLNAIASFRIGRDYLLSIYQGKKLLYELSLALRIKRLGNHATNHLLSTLQKLSIRSTAQKEMILCGMIEWTLRILDLSGTHSSELMAVISTASSMLNSSFGNTTTSLNSKNDHSTHFNARLEHALCLLSNLLLNTMGQATVLRYRDQIIAILSHLLTYKPILTRQVCRLLYCVMGSYARVRQAARERDLNAILNDRVAKAPNLDTHCQLAVVQHLLNGEITFIKSRRSIDEEDTKYEDYLEAEIDSTDSLCPTLADSFGEKLLRQKFSTASDEPYSQIKNMKTDVLNIPGTVVSITAQRQNIVRIRPQKQEARHEVSSSKQPAQSMMKNCGKPVFKSKIKECNTMRFAKNERTNSMMSNATFVLENDKRRPLILQCGFDEAVLEISSSFGTAKLLNSRSSSLINMRISEKEQPCTSPEPTYSTELKSSFIIPSERSQKPQNNYYFLENHYTAGTQPAMKRLPWTQPKSGETKKCETDEKENTVATKNNNNADMPSSLQKSENKEKETMEYVKAFASRPKISRTPDCRN